MNINMLMWWWTLTTTVSIPVLLTLRGQMVPDAPSCLLSPPGRGQWRASLILRQQPGLGWPGHLTRTDRWGARPTGRHGYFQRNFHFCLLGIMQFIWMEDSTRKTRSEKCFLVGIRDNQTIISASDILTRKHMLPWKIYQRFPTRLIRETFKIIKISTHQFI